MSEAPLPPDEQGASHLLHNTWYVLHTPVAHCNHTFGGTQHWRLHFSSSEGRPVHTMPLTERLTHTLCRRHTFSRENTSGSDNTSTLLGIVRAPLHCPPTCTSRVHRPKPPVSSPTCAWRLIGARD